MYSLTKESRPKRRCLSRMENTVLGNALEGVPEEEEGEEEEKPKDSNIEGTENIDGEEAVRYLVNYSFPQLVLTLLSNLNREDQGRAEGSGL